MKYSIKIGVSIILSLLFVSSNVMADNGAVFFKFDKACINYSDTLSNQIKCIFKVNDDQGISLKFAENGVGSFYNQNKSDSDGQQVFVETYNWPIILNSKQSDEYTKIMNYTFDNKSINGDLLKLGLLFLNNKAIDSSNSVIIDLKRNENDLKAVVTGNMITKDNLFQLGDNNPIYCKIQTKASDVYISCNCTGFND